MPSFRGPTCEQINSQFTDTIIIRGKNAVTHHKQQNESPSSDSTCLSSTKYKGGTNLPHSRISKIERNDQDGNFHVKRVPLDLSRKIQQARQDLGWTQKELAARAQVPIDIVRNYERGTATANGNIVTKLRRVLHI